MNYSIPIMQHQQSKTITIPSNWTLPKYQLGQRVRQGLIVGVEYYPGDTERGNKFGEGWVYWVLFGVNSEDTENFTEESIKPLSLEQLRALIQTEVESHQSRLAALTEQLELVEGAQC